MRETEVASKELADLLGVLAHPQRVQIVEELRRDERDVSALAAALGAPQARVSQHLSLMRAHHVVTDRRDGRHVYYRLVDKGLAAWLLSGFNWIGVESGDVEGLVSAIEASKALWGG